MTNAAMTRFGITKHSNRQSLLFPMKEGVGLTPAMDTEDDNNMEYSQIFIGFRHARHVRPHRHAQSNVQHG